MEARCRLCGGLIQDADAVMARYPHQPKLCEVCRRKVRDYRLNIPVKHELIAAWVVKLDRSLTKEWIPQTEDNRGEPIKGNALVYAIGGRFFGPWGGVVHTGKYLFFVQDTEVSHDRTYLLRAMDKIMMEDDQEVVRWRYYVLEPIDMEADFLLKLKFTRIYKRTLKGYGRQFDELYPIEEAYYPVLEGGSSCRSGRYGNSWCLYVTPIVSNEAKGGDSE